MDVSTKKNYPSEVSIMIVRQHKVLSQVDAFKIFLIINLMCLTDFMKYIFDIYLNNIYHIVFAIHLIC